MSLLTWTRRRPLAAYFLLACAISWIAVSPLVLAWWGLVGPIAPAWHGVGALMIPVGLAALVIGGPRRLSWSKQHETEPAP